MTIFSILGGIGNLPMIILFLSLFQGFYQEEIMAKDLKFKLLSGDQMPLVGFGTYQIQGADLIKDVLDKALAAGYRLIDTAKVYHNEKDIGVALKELLPKYKLKREDIFITSKLSPADQGEKAYEALKESVTNLDCGYLDLYLIHWPGVFGTNSSSSSNLAKRDLSWQMLVKGVKDGLTRNIGVSNYNVRHMNQILKNDHGIKPAVNQVEWHPHYHQPELKQLLEKEGILLQAYSSLGGSNNPDLLKDKVVNEIAKKLGKSPAQVLLQWSLQQNIAIIPKARSQKHIEDNINLNFRIPDEDMEKLNNFSQNKYSWDPDTIA
ncbi:glyoxal reductase-like [Aethina tumida]|uniref:glyoxal reductase-like n=1 Tax=Aethina tumida TaxID=116153 RepID=UPI00096B5CE7|nr:glyoxal reductase-like [Aethina tumida]